MTNPATAQWPRALPRLDSASHLRILFITIYVRDVDRSIRFYVDQLGFNLIFDSPVAGGRFVAVGPPDGSAVLAFARVPPDSDEYHSIRRTAPIVFLTENVVARYEQWERAALNSKNRHTNRHGAGCMQALKTRMETP